MATVFETRLIGNIGKDANVRQAGRGIIAINFPVAHNKNWRDKKTGESRTKTVWINCTIWKRESSNIRILDFLKSGNLVELTGTPYAKAYQQEDGTIKTEIRLNVSKTNILRMNKNQNASLEDNYSEESDEDLDDFYAINENDFE